MALTEHESHGSSAYAAENVFFVMRSSQILQIFKVPQRWQKERRFNHWQANDENLLNPLNLHAQLQTGFTELEVMLILQILQ
jgi:hypothetical protein